MTLRHLHFTALALALLCITFLAPARAGDAVRVLPPANVGRAVHAAMAYHDSGAYAADLERVGKAALACLATSANQGNKSVIVLDVDETSLSNWQEMKRLNLGFNLEEWSAWASSGKAPAIAPTLDLAREADRLGVGVVFLTGRRESLRNATEHNLRAAGYPRWVRLIMRPNNNHSPANLYKTKARANLEEEGYDILLNMGDQESDLVGGHARAVFKLPNPFYWIPSGY